MKRSELKEAIKAEIKSVLTENVNPDLERKIVNFVRKCAHEYGIPVYNAFLSIEAKMAEMKDFFGEGKYSLEEITEAKFIKFKGDSDDNKMEVEAEREMNTPDGELKVYTVKTDDGVQSYTADQVELVEENSLNEEAGFTEVSKKEIKFHLDQFYGGNIDGNDLANAIEEIVFNRVSFSDVREDEDEDDKAASKSAKKEKLGKQASKLSQEDEDRYERIKNGLEKLKKKGDEESIKKMKAILGKKDVEELIKSKGRTKASFM